MRFCSISGEQKLISASISAARLLSALAASVKLAPLINHSRATVPAKIHSLSRTFVYFQMLRAGLINWPHFLLCVDK
jgi:hypothetical protein